MWKKYCFQPKSLNDIKDTAYIVLDTNVLLAAYQWRNITIDVILDSLEKIAEQGRLRIPSHVIREFTRRRPALIKEMIHNIKQSIDQWQKPSDLSVLVPTLVNTEEFIVAQQNRETLIEKRKIYVNNLQALQEKLAELLVNDPVLERYKSIFEKSYFNPEDLDSDEELERQFIERQKKGIPPGNKDKTKEINSSGDYKIWASMLKLHEDAIFVSNDTKPDWVVADSYDNILSPRRELIEEFYEATGGKTFLVVKPSTFFSHILSLSDEVQIDIKENEKEKDDNEMKANVILDLTERDLYKFTPPRLLPLLIQAKQHGDLKLYEDIISEISNLYYLDSMGKDTLYEIELRDSIRYFKKRLQDSIK